MSDEIEALFAELGDVDPLEVLRILNIRYAAEHEDDLDA